MVLKLGTWWHLCKKPAHRIDHPSPTNTFFLLRGWDNITSDIYRQCFLKCVEQESAGQERKKNKSQVIAHIENHSSYLRTQLYVEYEKYDLKYEFLLIFIVDIRECFDKTRCGQLAIRTVLLVYVLCQFSRWIISY